VQVALQRRFGAQIQTSMDEQVLWFEWQRAEPVDLTGVYRAVIGGGMGLSGFRLLGDFVFGENSAQLRDARSPELTYRGPARAAGPWDIEVAGYESRDRKPAVVAVRDYKRPQAYQE
jgi:hypothetical protein